MRSIVKQIPNTITCLNLFSGCMALLAAFEFNTERAALWVALAALFDFCDGLAARLLHAYSPLGKELDSLADLVSFGVVPGLLVFRLIQTLSPTPECDLMVYLPYVAFLIPIFSALRLAKFNLDTRQTESFIGLPVPADALFWIGLCFYAVEVEASVWCIYPLVGVFSYLLVSEIPMMSLKFKNLSLKENYLRFLLLLLSGVLLLLLGVAGASAAIGLYILLSLLQTRLNK